MKFIVIDPAKTSTYFVEAENMQDLYSGLGLDEVDHSILLPPAKGRAGLAIVVNDCGFFVPPEKQRYFAIGNRLFAGPAIVYGFTEDGSTVDPDVFPLAIFMTVTGIEKAIEDGQIVRPTCSINDEVLWQWPQPDWRS